MRVLKTSSPGPGDYLLRFEDNFVPGRRDLNGQIIHYAILSHAWEDEEVIYTDVTRKRAKRKRGFKKLARAIDQAKTSGCDYLWAVSLSMPGILQTILSSSLVNEALVTDCHLTPVAPEAEREC